MCEECELHWAAGYFNGCGYVSLRQNGENPRYPEIRLHRTHDKSSLDRFQAAVGIGKVYGPYGSLGLCQYVCNGKPQGDLLARKLWPCLSEMKHKHLTDRGIGPDAQESPEAADRRQATESLEADYDAMSDEWLRILKSHQ